VQRAAPAIAKLRHGDPAANGAYAIGVSPFSYRHGLLDPRIEDGLPPHLRAAAEAANAPLLGPRTLGIEVTVPALARRCGLGNIDPQHGGNDGGSAAIDLCLGLPVPPIGTILVTVRPDVDALGSMALLGLRATGATCSAALIARVRAISTADRFACGPWPGPKPLPRSPDDLDRASPLAGVAELAADPALPLSERVAGIAAWLATGAAPPVDLSAERRRARELLDRLAAGLDTIEPVLGGRAALVRAQSGGALRLGYRLAPVVIAENPAFGQPPHRKLTIAQYAAGHADLHRVAGDLAACEPGWGGSATLVGSPQGRAAGLPLSMVIDTVARHLRRS
jgi:hypothetical protein